MNSKRLNPLKIGALELANPLLLAPLSGISNLPFRLLAKEQGCAAVFTEMISAEGLLRNWKDSERFLKSCPEERPLGVQIFGSRPETMSEAARIIEGHGAEALDINMGCPVRKVVQTGAGAALLKNLELAEKIIREVRRSISIPLTIKIRLGWDGKSLNFLETVRMAEACGVDAVFLHGRTRAQGYDYRADWREVGRAREAVRIPVIGSGDLTSPEAILKFLEQTGCPGAMIGRGALGNPWIFRQSLGMLRGKPVEPPSLEEKEATILRHLKMMVQMRGEVHGCKEFRKHLIWYTRGLRGSADFRFRIPRWEVASEMAEGMQEYFEALRRIPPESGNAALQ